MALVPAGIAALVSFPSVFSARAVALGLVEIAPVGLCRTLLLLGFIEVAPADLCRSLLLLGPGQCLSVL